MILGLPEKSAAQAKRRESMINDPLYKFGKLVAEAYKGISKENQYDLFTESSSWRDHGVLESMKNFFIEESFNKEGLTAEQIEEAVQEKEVLFENDMEAVREFSSIGAYNPVIGLTHPMHKLIAMNCIFDQGVIQKAVSAVPKFTLSMEYREMVDIEGNVIDLIKEQEKIYEAMEKTAPIHDVVIALPENGTTDVLTKIGANPNIDNLSIETKVQEVKVAIETDAGIVDVWVPIKADLTPGYGNYDKSYTETLTFHNLKNVKKDGTEEVVNQKTGTSIIENLTIMQEGNKFVIYSSGKSIKAVKLAARKDCSNGLQKTASVRQGHRDTFVEIPTAIPISTAISPEELKDVQALYGENQLTRIMSMINEVMKNHKDDKIKNNLDNSFSRLDRDHKVKRRIDLKPRDGAVLSDVQWRQEVFMDRIDTVVTDLLEILRDPNVTISFLGRAEIIRKVIPTEYKSASAGELSGIPLEFGRSIYTSDNRLYNFVSSLKFNTYSKESRNELMIIINPKNTQRVVYRICDYQMYVSGTDIKNSVYFTLPNVHAFERWKFLEYEGVQGRLEVNNVSAQDASTEI